MMTRDEKIIRNKVGVLELAKQLGSVSHACRIMGFSRDSFYRFKELYEKGGEAALIEMSRRVPNPKNRVAEAIERRIMETTLQQPAWGHTRIANELSKEGLRVSPTGVRGVLVRHDLNTMAKRLKASPLRGVVDRHLVRDASGWHALVYLHYRGEEFKRNSFLAELRAIDPQARATGVELISDELAGSVQRSFALGFVLGGLLVLCLLVAHFESLAGIFYSLYPVVCGAVAMLGTMVLCGMRLNFMNAMVLVTIVGMGSDYGLHVGHRLTAADETEREQQFVQAGRAVFLSALTTIAGFGSLAFTDYGAMSSIGWATNFGVGFTALFALASLPAFLARRLPGPTSRDN